MKFIFGVIVGAALLLSAAYLHDTGAVHFGPRNLFVNWDTVFELLGH